ncbi:MAG: hypothetical protein KA004_17325 [Verrucomicrobiales bacterium]|nr:hypothetical protein [Verrucomicrobiales bacterium]
MKALLEIPLTEILLPDELTLLAALAKQEQTTIEYQIAMAIREKLERAEREQQKGAA